MIEIKHICVKSTDSVLDAMKIIENSHSKIVLVIDEQGRLLGTVTDGDVRRGLIKNIMLNQEVSNIMNRKPFFAKENTSENKITSIFLNKKISQLPIVNDQHQVVGLRLSPDLASMQKKNNPVILMAGGLGTRLGELTQDCPKPMLKVGEKPILEVVLENLKEHGFWDFKIAVNYKAEIIENYFGNGDKHSIRIQYLREQKRLGTAGALSLFKPETELPVLVMNGDVLTKVDFTNFVESHEKNRSFCTMCVRKYDFQIPFGVVKVSPQQKVLKIEEKPTQTLFVNAGIYAIDPKAISYVPHDTYFDMPQLLNKVLEKHPDQTNVFPIHEYWMDVGRRDDFNQAQVDFKKVF